MPARDARNPSIQIDQFKYVYSSAFGTGQQYYRCSHRRPTLKRPDRCLAALIVNCDGSIDPGYESQPHTPLARTF